MITMNILLVRTGNKKWQATLQPVGIVGESMSLGSVLHYMEGAILKIGETVDNFRDYPIPNNGKEDL